APADESELHPKPHAIAAMNEIDDRARGIEKERRMEELPSRILVRQPDHSTSGAEVTGSDGGTWRARHVGSFAEISVATHEPIDAASRARCDGRIVSQNNAGYATNSTGLTEDACVYFSILSNEPRSSGLLAKSGISKSLLEFVAQKCGEDDGL